MAKKRTVAKQTTAPRDERERQRSRRPLRDEKITVEEIFTIETLDELRRHLDLSAGSQLRDALLREFWRVCKYSNAEEWNRAVRVCESLAIIGWGDYEPVEAICGEDWTAFRNRRNENRFLSAAWSKRKDGITIRPGSAHYHASPDLPEGDGEFASALSVQNLKLACQRNWIPKPPIRLYQWLDSSDAATRKLVDAINGQLVPSLDRQMKPQVYGSAIDQIWIDFYFCTNQRGFTVNFVVIDDDARLSSVALHKRLLKMYPAAQIRRENLFLRKRFDYGAFQADKGTMKVTLHFPREFNAQSLPAQKREFAQHLSTAVAGVIARLEGRGLDYDFSKMQRDFEVTLQSWLKTR